MIDSHCHLDAEQYDEDRDAVIERARNAGVSTVVVPGTDLASSEKAVALSQGAHPIPLHATVGVHPHGAKDYLDALPRLRGLAASAVAIGETGLDFHYTFSPAEVQCESLRAHVRLARELGLPLVLHCREAEPALLQILEEERAGECGGVVHCYTGTMETAMRVLDMGLYLGFTGIVTFKNAAPLRDILARVPLERILLETDGPYLAPIPHRGKRNEPSFLPRIAEAVAEVKQIAVSEMTEIAAENTRRLFRLA